MFSGGAGDRLCLGGGIKIRLGAINRGLGICNGAAGGLRICLGFCHQLARIFDQALRRLMPRRQSGNIFGLFGQHGFSFLQHRRRLTRGGLRSVKLIFVTSASFLKFARFPF